MIMLFLPRFEKNRNRLRDLYKTCEENDYLGEVGKCICHRCVM